jgi:glycosyltransferase involved in cell wall biosynthesis
MDVFVLSSKTEGLPIALLEAMSNERPVVSTAVGGIPAVIEDGKNGILVPSDSESELRSALQSLREAPARAEALGRNAKTLAVERYGMDRMVDAYLDLYRKVGAPA